MPAPFIQIKLLKILALLGNGDKQASEKMYTVVGDIFKKCDSASNIGNAVLYECICCVSSIYSNPKLLEGATEVISRFLKSDSHNLKYMGIDALGRLIKLSPEIAEQHQLAVIDCLEDPDDTLKRKTFELLYKMTKSSNVEVIVDRMIDYMISINDNHYKTYIASRCVELAEQFAPSNNWFIQTMNKVFEHAGDLVNVKVAHNLMRLIAEGFGEDDETADAQLRFSAVQSYLRILAEPKLPSVFLQVICWVLGEYGIADGKYSASYIIGKLCDVAEANSNDETVRAYAITAIMKIYAFEIAAGRKVDMLPECQSLVEELSASHSTDMQQRAYELQVVIDLDAHAVGIIMPSDASCEDIEIDKDLSFLNNYVDQSIEKGAQPYIPESERSGVLSISTLGSQDQYEASSHGLRFEAYELPKPPVPSRVTPLTSSTEIVPQPEPSYPRETHQAAPVPSVLDAGQSELKLRLDGVQKKWGRPTYSSSPSSTSTSTSTSTSQKTTNGVAQDVASSAGSRSRETYDSRKPQVEISPEKQKLVASLFGGSSKTERKSSTANQKTAKTSSSHGAEKLQVQKVATVATEVAVDRTNHQPPPDLLDLSEAPVGNAPLSVDPFKQLESLLDPAPVTSVVNNGSGGASKAPDLMGLYGDSAVSGQSSSLGFDINVTSEFSSVASTDQGRATVSYPVQLSKGPNTKDSLEKDALVRQMGVNPSSQNPNLFKDLLG